MYITGAAWRNEKSLRALQDRVCRRGGGDGRWKSLRALQDRLCRRECEDGRWNPSAVVGRLAVGVGPLTSDFRPRTSDLCGFCFGVKGSGQEGTRHIKFI